MSGLALILTGLALLVSVVMWLITRIPPLEASVEEALRYDKTPCPDCGVDVWAEEP